MTDFAQFPPTLTELAEHILVNRDAVARAQPAAAAASLEQFAAGIRDYYESLGIDFDDPVAARAVIVTAIVMGNVYIGTCANGRPADAFLQAYNAAGAGAVAAAERHRTQP